MARVRLIHWNGPEGRERALRLASLGHHAEFHDYERLGLMRMLRANPPDAYVIDLSRMPSHGREVAMALRTYRDTRHVPLVFVDGDPEKVARLKTLLPDAVYTTWPRLKTALPKAIARPLARPIVPPSSIYTGRSVVEKLGVKAGMRVCVVAAPPEFGQLLRPVPKGAAFTARPSPDCDLFLVFVRSRREAALGFGSAARHVARQPLWMIWPKKTSGVRTDVDANVIRETGIAAGWVDYKVCSIDDTWSGYAFKRRT